MDPQMKLLLEEIKNLSQTVMGVEKSLGERIAGVEQSLGLRFQAMEAAATTFDSWKPQIDEAVEDLKLEVGVLRKHVNRVVLEQSAPSRGLLFKTEAVLVPPSPEDKAAGPDRHREDKPHRETEFGKVFTHSHLPATSG
ncbi:hypothetical protein ACP4OV_015741 [Aristida adscensionis]